MHSPATNGWLVETMYVSGQPPFVRDNQLCQGQRMALVIAINVINNTILRYIK